jgi:starvation-inducible DNA-binding protein
MESLMGIKSEDRSEVVAQLDIFLADEFLLYLKTRNAHWNIEGPDFHAMHKFFEDQYELLADLVDNVAERIRTLGHYAPATLKAYLELTHLTEESRKKNDSAGFIKDLLGDHESIITRLRENANHFANDLEDIGTSDFITGLLETHEKMAWMLRAHLKN